MTNKIETSPQKFFYVPVPEEEFYEKLGDSILDRIRESKLLKPTESKKWLTHREAAAYINKSADALYKLTAQRKVKYSKRGKQNYFLKECLDEYLNAGTIKTMDEVKADVKLLTRKNEIDKSDSLNQIKK